MEGTYPALAQQGGFAVLAAVCVWAIVAVVKIGIGQMERSHLRETEVLKILAADRGDMLKQYTDVMLEVRSALVSLQEEIYEITHPNEGRSRLSRSDLNTRANPIRGEKPK